MGTRENRLAEAVLTSTHSLCFEQKYKKNIRGFLSENFQCFGGEIFYIFELASFRNESLTLWILSYPQGNCEGSDQNVQMRSLS